jgi:hypothetical protein
VNTGTDISPDLCRAEVGRLLGSETFRNAESLRKLLQYLADASLGGQARHLKEYTVGIEALGKRPDYDPRADSSVRVQVGKLRQKVDEYYQKEGAADPVLIECPKGHFELKFLPQPAPRMEPPAVAEASELKPIAGPTLVSNRWRTATIALAGIVAAVIVIAALVATRTVTAGRSTSSTVWTRDVVAFWKPFVESPKPLLIALGTPMFLKMDKDFVRDPTANDAGQVAGSEVIAKIRKALAPTVLTPSYSYTGTGEAIGAALLTQFLALYKPDVVLKRSISLGWEDLRSNNVVFIGPPKFNPQLTDLPIEQDFVIENGAIVNHRPLNTELERYVGHTQPSNEDIPEEYALITRLGPVEGWGDLLVLASTSTEGSRAAVEYVTRPDKVNELFKHLSPDGEHMPAYYQVVIKGKFKAQVPLQISYITHHILSAPRQKR